MNSGCVGIVVGFVGAIAFLFYIAHSEGKTEESSSVPLEEQIAQCVEEETQRRIDRINECYERERLQRENTFKEVSQKLLSEMEQTHQRGLADQAQQRKWDELRRFSLKEVPDAWLALSKLKAEQVSLERHISELEAVLKSFGKPLAADAELAQLRKSKEVVEGQINDIVTKLEGAYVLSKKNEAMPNVKSFEGAVQESANDGLFSAEMLEQHYRH